MPWRPGLRTSSCCAPERTVCAWLTHSTFARRAVRLTGLPLQRVELPGADGAASRGATPRRSGHCALTA